MPALSEPRPFTQGRKILLRVIGGVALLYALLFGLRYTTFASLPVVKALRQEPPIASIIFALIAGIFLLAANGINERLHRRTYSLRLQAKRARLDMQSARTGFVRNWWREEGRSLLNYIIDPRGNVAAWMVGGAAGVVLLFAFAAEDLGTQQDDLTAGAWQAYVAFAAAALPILVFVIEIAKGDRTIASTTTEVLIRESRVFPIFVLVMAAAIVFAISQLPTIAAIAVLASGILAIAYAYGRTLQLLVDRNHLRRGEVALIRERVRADIRATLEERIAFNILRRFMEANGGELNPFAGDIFGTSERGYDVFPSKRGVLHDINLFLLKDLLGVVPGRGHVDSAGSTGSPAAPEPAGPAGKPAPPRLTTPLEHQVSPERALLRLPEQAGGSSRSIDITAESIFSIRELQEGRQDPLRENLTDVQRGIVRAIRQRDATDVSSGLDLYRDVLRSFLQMLGEHGVQYDRSQAAGESALFTLGEWQALEWLQEGARSLLFEAFDHPHRDVIRSVLYFPISLASIGLGEGDYLTFHRLVRDFYGHAYRLALRLEDGPIKDLAVDRSWRFPKEFLDIRLGMHLQGRPDAAKVASVAELAEGVILIYNDLLKAAFDNGQLDHFRLFSRLLNDVAGDRFGSRVPGYEDWAMRRRYGGNDNTREEPVFEAVWDLSNRLQRLKRIAALGLQAWVIRQFTHDRISPAEVRQWFDPLYPGGSLLEKGEALLKGWTDISHEDQLRWSSWEMEGMELAQPMATRLTHDADLMTGYVLHALQEASQAQPQADEFPQSRDFEVLVSDQGQLRNILQELTANPGKWQPLVPLTLEEAGENLVRSWDAYLLRREEAHRLAVIDAPLDEAAVREFSDDIAGGFRRAAGFLDVLEAAKAIDRTEMRSDASPVPIGYYQLLEKRFFVSLDRIRVFGWDGYGNEVARGIVSRALTTITTAAPCVPMDPADPAGLKALTSQLAELRNKGYSEPVIVVSGSWSVTSAMWERQPEFVPSPVGRTPQGQIGTWHGAPVYTYPMGPHPVIVIADFTRVGMLKLYQADEAEEGTMLLQTMRFSVRPISEEEALRMVAEHPEVYRKSAEGEDPLTTEEAIRKLRARVRFELDVSGEFVITDSGAARCVTLHEEDVTPEV